MSIFRETFPTFIQNELTRRQDGMLARTPAFLHQLNSRSAWVRMTSGVDYEGSSALAKNYVLQGGTLFYSVEDSKDKFSQRQGIGNSSATYSNKSITGEYKYVSDSCMMPREDIYELLPRFDKIQYLTHSEFWALNSSDLQDFENKLKILYKGDKNTEIENTVKIMEDTVRRRVEIDKVRL